MLRTFAILLSAAVTLSILWMQREFLRTMGVEFMWGYLAGAVSIVALQWGLWKLTGETIFTDKGQEVASMTRRAAEDSRSGQSRL